MDSLIKNLNAFALGQVKKRERNSYNFDIFIVLKNNKKRLIKTF
jgi:hypothetical protein